MPKEIDMMGRFWVMMGRFFDHHVHLFVSPATMRTLIFKGLEDLLDGRLGGVCGNHPQLLFDSDSYRKRGAQCLRFAQVLSYMRQSMKLPDGCATIIQARQLDGCKPLNLEDAGRLRNGKATDLRQAMLSDKPQSMKLQDMGGTIM